MQNPVRSPSKVWVGSGPKKKSKNLREKKAKKVKKKNLAKIEKRKKTQKNNVFEPPPPPTLWADRGGYHSPMGNRNPARTATRRLAIQEERRGRGGTAGGPGQAATSGSHGASHPPVVPPGIGIWGGRDVMSD